MGTTVADVRIKPRSAGFRVPYCTRNGEWTDGDTCCQQFTSCGGTATVPSAAGGGGGGWLSNRAVR